MAEQRSLRFRVTTTIQDWIDLQLRRASDSHLLLELTDDELSVLQNGLNEALEALDGWEFTTRMGVDQTEALRIMSALRSARASLMGE
jgi:hypothetical protein